MATIKNGVAELDAFEAASYWWVKRIKSMAKEIQESPIMLTPKHYEFAQIFDYQNLKNEGYRKLYQELAEKIKERMEGHSRIVMRTYAKKTGHEELLSWLTEIMGVEVPVLNIGELGGKDISISIINERGVGTTAFIGESTMNSIKTRLPNRFKVNPVLCGKPQSQEEEKGNE